jgi:hypothetical protein
MNDNERDLFNDFQRRINESMNKINIGSSGNGRGEYRYGNLEKEFNTGGSSERSHF